MQVCLLSLTFWMISISMPSAWLDNHFVFTGDPAYPIRVHHQCPFRNGVLTPQMEAYNTPMSTVRTSVEWLFGDIINYSIKFLDFKKNLK